MLELKQKPDLQEIVNLNKVEQTLELARLNAELEDMTTQQRIAWALNNLQGSHALSSSFGAQAAVMLHLVTRQQQDIAVILTDTGYLFPETYQFIDELTVLLGLNLKVYKSVLSSAWQEARYGQLWNKGVEGLTQYNQLNKVEPMRRALTELNVGTWFSGLRRSQSDSRQGLPILSIQNGVFKFLPIVDWTSEQINQYIEEHGLPQHPLKEQGYISIGDVHTTTKYVEGMKEQDTRFFGLKRECGLHEDNEEENGSGI
ncbi:phosphoadenosine phosphosulfate reductase [Vibrio sp. UCD-FRSSP16_10]|uniref:phosphoadenylyl-sulfate reductase n=1 Tax=unclassified Vibrio TaxID=2614977 RepID=UPI0007FD5B65|nr:MULTISPECIES: phosphoadenylyl-sulfate reductase [unclassified Vibrio]OBT16365.1 phosphoadenosine phosphosulfate reductase [Vibrio sp. UCD-FRSSP16_30]OBT21229.1 phosphoadenosine phosphosulfate reductase [Vibrio sp. UCD-FRSSP16_10]